MIISAPQRHPRGIGILGIIAILFFVIVAVLGATVIIMITRAGGLEKLLQQQAKENLKLTPSALVQAPPEQYRIADIVTTDDPSFGNTDAQLIIVEFGDFQCPFCREAFPIIREVMTKYQDRIRFIYRDYLNPAHKDAAKAAEAGQCAWDESHEKFWAFHDKLYQYQEDLSVLALKRYAASVGLDTRRFDACLDEGRFGPETQADFRAAEMLGVPGTPTWFIIYGDQVRRVPGVQQFGFWQELIEKLTAQDATATQSRPVAP